ncbi:MAG: CBS domain-containing protein [Desulfobacterales bacterium]|nr:MAG: CBS domain-containing protein [Desulfobacterales bacterium]
MSKPVRNTLSGLVVGQAMRRQIIQRIQDTTIANSISALVKYKVNALLTTDQAGKPIGVLSKTDIMGAYYAGLPIDSPVEDIMSRPPLFCDPGDALDKALQSMRSQRIYRLYVMDPKNKDIVGTLAYPDIVGLLYKYCHECEYSDFRQKNQSNPDSIQRFFVKEIMTNEVKSVFKDDSLRQVMEELSVSRLGAILVKNSENYPCGVVSKTDLALAYKHGIDPQAPAETIMSSPVQSCGADELLEDAIRKMIFADVQRLFVYQSNPMEPVGVISLSDAARIRSGSCHACISSRIELDA